MIKNRVVMEDKRSLFSIIKPKLLKSWP